eukprot:scaffold59893_cov46-Phaeocystis_antarctica.AAC.1
MARGCSLASRRCACLGGRSGAGPKRSSGSWIDISRSGGPARALTAALAAAVLLAAVAALLATVIAPRVAAAAPPPALTPTPGRGAGGAHAPAVSAAVEAAAAPPCLTDPAAWPSAGNSASKMLRLRSSPSLAASSSSSSRPSGSC